MRDIPFVDAHVHFWELGRLSYPWLTPPFDDEGPNGSTKAIASDYRLDEYLTEASGWSVRGLVHVEAGADPTQAIDETAWLQATAEAHGLPSGLVAHAALDDPELDAKLDAQAAHGRLRGIRHIVNWHPEPRRTYTKRDVTADHAWRSGFARLARHGLSFDLQCYPSQMPALAPLFASHPDVPVIVNHIGMPVPSDPDSRSDWLNGLAALAALPQVAIKLSGAGFITRDWNVESLRPWVLEAIDLFGPDRCLVASDFPTDRLFGSYDATLGAYVEIISPFSETERRAMWGGNANRVYRLGIEL